MNQTKLKQAEATFLKKYPGGFNNEHFSGMEKKYKMAKHTDFAGQSFGRAQFKDPQTVLEAMIKLIGQSAMVSVFEKPKFRDFARALPADDKTKLAAGLQKMLHGKNQQSGFEAMLEVLKKGKLAKWSLITCIPAYYRPDEEIFIKPTTAKGVIAQFELKGLEYKPTPSWEFYAEYRRQILTMKNSVDKNLSPNNAAFGGFLMMSLEGF